MTSHREFFQQSLSLLSRTFIIAVSLMIMNGAIGQETLPPPGMVEVEPPYLTLSDATGEFIVVPYSQRRAKWSKTVSVGYSMYAPENYQPDFDDTTDFIGIYGEQAHSLIEASWAVKRNFSLGSFGGEIGFGMYNRAAVDSLINSSLNLIPVRLGLQLTLDNLAAEPFIAPYLAGGLYTVVYSETLEAQEFGGTTQAAPYFAAGALFQLNWLDRAASVESYNEYGIENTFLYLEGRMFTASGAEQDPDFSSSVHVNAGFRLEM